MYPNPVPSPLGHHLQDNAAGVPIIKPETCYRFHKVIRASSETATATFTHHLRDVALSIYLPRYLAWVQIQFRVKAL